MNHAGEVLPIGYPVDYVTGTGNNGQGSSPALRSLAIVGSHPDTRENAPYDDPDFDIWLFNEAPQKQEIYKRWDACLQIHQEKVYTSVENWVNKDHWEWLQQDHGDKRIFMQDIDPRVPNSVKYPLDEVMALVPYKYLRSSPAMALALGIYLGYKRIELYGSELSSNTEYTYQAVNYAFWIGFAHGYGVDLRMECWHKEFYEHPIYGYEGETQLPQSYFEGRVMRLETEYRGKKSGYEKVKSRLKDAMMKADFDKAAELSIVAETLAKSVGELEEAMAEANRYKDRTNEISRQEFERVSAQAQKDGPEAEYEVAKNAGICEYVWNAWRLSGKHEALTQFRHFLDKKLDAAEASGRLSGKFVENLEYMREYDRLVTAAGGQRAVHQVQAVANG